MRVTCFSCRTKLFAGSMLAAMVAAAMPAWAELTISNEATQNVTCSAGVCTATAKKAVLNVDDLTNLLAGSSVEVTTGSATPDIRIAVPLSSSAASTLTLDSQRSVAIDQPVSLTGSGGLAITLNDGGGDGLLSFGKKGNVTFASLASSLVIGGQSFTLVDSIATLASAIAGNPGGSFALANSYDAAGDGTYKSSPIVATLTGTFEGLGNTIFHLAIDTRTRGYVGLFAETGTGSTVRDVGVVDVRIATASYAYVGALIGYDLGDSVLHAYATGRMTVGKQNVAGGLIGLVDSGTVADSYADVSIESKKDAGVGGLVGTSGGTITHCHATGALTSRVTVGGLVSNNYGPVLFSYATGPVTGQGTSSPGGLVAYNEAEIDQSFATGTVTGRRGGAAYSGGLVGLNADYDDARITNSYATGAVSIGNVVGGLVGDNQGVVERSYSTGAVSGGVEDEGGLIGFQNPTDGHAGHDYWDTTTSGVTNLSDGAGGMPNFPGIKGLTTKQFQKRLPNGFDSKIWREDPNVNGGLPYLIANPPPS